MTEPEVDSEVIVNGWPHEATCLVARFPILDPGDAFPWCTCGQDMVPIVITVDS